MRAFLALPVGPPAHNLLTARIEGLRRQVAGVRWVETATTHLTLHFFADLPVERMGAVVKAVGAVAADQAPFALRLGDFGSFPGGARTRVLWLGLAEEPAALAALAAGVRAAVAGCGFEIDPRPFRAHVTLGRPGAGFDRRAWRAAAAEPFEPAGFIAATETVVPSEGPGFTASEVVLYESRGGRHHVRDRLPLGGAAGSRGPS